MRRRIVIRRMLAGIRGFIRRMDMDMGLGLVGWVEGEEEVVVEGTEGEGADLRSRTTSSPSG